ncbi:MAG: single-stranded-DNA-specific exonuclease RecJ [Candidatus Promineifilaceae bacterium]
MKQVNKWQIAHHPATLLPLLIIRHPLSIYQSGQTCYHSAHMFRPTTLRKIVWQIAPPVPDEIKRKLGHLHPVLLQVLYNRGLVDEAHIQAFLDGRYLEQTDPFLLADMDTAVARIQQAIHNNEQIIVYGDFDADGVTATVLLTEALRALGTDRNKVRPYIPDRVDEGYGLNFDALTKIREEFGATLAITVDCGIRSVAEVEHAQNIGLDMIITDHHSISPQLPPALAVINPKRPDSAYPEKMLAGVGIAYKVAQALHTTANTDFDLDSLLDLVAIGTVADLAPLMGENRKLVRDGLVVLNQLRRPGLAALVKESRLQPGSLTAESIGFGIGPRINAAGRLSHAYTAAKLLAINNMPQAIELARELDTLNQRRQVLTRELGQKAEALIKDLNAPILIAADPNFVAGVVGLVASRLADKNYRPALVIEQGEEESRGSCRSIPEFHITEALDEVADLLVRHGGHAQAAGFTILNENLAAFRERMVAIAQKKLAGKELLPTISIDQEIDLALVDWSLHAQLMQLEPTGYGNRTPIFVSRNVEVQSHRVVGQDGAHLQIQLSADTPGSPLLSAIAFRQGSWAAHMPQFIDVVYTIGVNEWNGRKTLQLIVQDLQPAGTQ